MPAWLRRILGSEAPAPPVEPAPARRRRRAPRPRLLPRDLGLSAYRDWCRREKVPHERPPDLQLIACWLASGTPPLEGTLDNARAIRATWPAFEDLDDDDPFADR